MAAGAFGNPPAASSRDTIAALATPAGSGGIGVIRVSGPDALPVLEKVIGVGGAAVPDRAVRFGRVVDEAGAVLDEVLYFAMRGPRSFTGEDVVEIHGHGGAVNMGLLLRTVLAAGARPAEPGEFTRRAFENGRIDLTRAEAVLEVIGAASERGVRAAQRRLQGELGGALRELWSESLSALAELEAGMDFPEEGNEDVATERVRQRAEALGVECTRMAGSFRVGAAVGRGVEVALCGAPNSGKSSLLNALCGMERAIVADEPGTTRDFVEAECEWEGIRVTLIDTAGRREATSEVEKKGMALGATRAAAADIRVELCEASGWDDAASGGLERAVLRVASKGDLGGEVPSGVIVTSARTGSGLEELRKEIVSRAVAQESEGEDGLLVASERQRDGLELAASAFARACERLGEQAAAEVVAFELRCGAEALAEILGERVVVEGMLDRLFAQFCIGK